MEYQRDPKDASYILLQRKIHATIVTYDKDIAAMGGRVAPIAVMATLRAYSRAAEVQVTLQVGGYTLGGLGLSALSGAAKLAYSSAKAASTKVPREVGLALVAAFCVAMVIPASRKWMWSQLEAAARPLGSAVESLAQVSSTLAAEFGQRKIETNEALSKVHALLGISSPEEKGELL
ncbi:hypothetical protein J2801_002792 [Paraburkholderia phenoliruptrix]|uniref:hypothetical protein n=1 Tax=Paraburkholderia phenoliruptrix TaxID=252970 RepID=UPI002861199B|nr:hypothetical protein [Paraburkholderia phenoliruptrix]MDR6420511.1 hypothetical protein [Paraburkholderia phenoliruptrix]